MAEGKLQRERLEWTKAVETYLQAVSHFQKAGDKSRESTTLNLVGNIYYLQSDKAKALDTYKQALKIAQETKDEAKEYIQRNINLIALPVGQPDSVKQRPELIIQTKHIGYINSVVVLPNGKDIVTAAEDGNDAVKLWDISNGLLVRNFSGKSTSNNHAVVSPDGKTIASIVAKKGIALWDVYKGKVIRSFTYPEPEPDGGAQDTNLYSQLVFSHDGKTIGGVLHQKIVLWDAASGKLLREIESEYGYGIFVFSPDDKMLAAVDIKKDVNLLNLTDGQLITKLPAGIDSSFYPQIIAFHPNGKTLAVLTGKIDLWDIESRSVFRTLPTKGGFYKGSVAFSPDGNYLLAVNAPRLSGDLNFRLETWDANNYKLLKHYEFSKANGGDDYVDGGAVNSIAFTPDSKYFITGGEKLCLWQTSEAKLLKEFHGERLGKPAVSNNTATLVDAQQKTILFGGDEQTRKVWTANASLRCTLESYGSFDRVSLASQYFTAQMDVGNGTRIVDFDYTTCKKLINVYLNREEEDLPYTFGANGKAFARMRKDGGIEIYGGDDGSLQLTLRGNFHTFTSNRDEYFSGFAFSPDSNLLAVTEYEDKSVGLWETKTGRLLKRLTSNTPVTNVLAFSPDGKFLAAFGYDTNINIWDVASGKLLYTLPCIEYSKPIPRFAFSADSKIFASVGKNNSINLWNTENGKLLRSFEGAFSNDLFYAGAMVFSPDSKTLFISDQALFSRDYINVWLLNLESGNIVLKLRGDRISNNGFVSASFNRDGKVIAVALYDKVKAKIDTEVYSTETGQKLASVIGFLDGNWIVVTPDGLFDGLPKAFNKLNWSFANNEVASVEAYFNEYFYPGLLDEILDGKKPTAKTDIVNKDRRQPDIKFSSVTGIDLPNHNLTVDSRNITIRLEVTEAPPDKTHPKGSGAQDVRLFRNNSLVKVWYGDLLKGQNKVTLETSVPIVAGENQFAAYAFNRDNIKSADAELTFTGSTSLARKGNLYVLSIGINEYENAQYNLKYANPDAQTFSNEIKLRQELLANFQSIEITELLDKDATKANFLLALQRLSGKSAGALLPNTSKQLLKLKQAQPEDSIVIYFSGHGTAQQDRFYLLPHDLGYQGARNKLDATAIQKILVHSISDKELEDAFSTIDAQNILFVIDACNSGQALESEEKRRGPMNSKGLAQLAYEKGMFILTASQSYEVAFESQALQHSYLNFALIEEALKEGKADSEPSDGNVMLREWLNYAVQRVPSMRQEQIRKTKDLVDEEEKRTTSGRVQQPRVFYRRENETTPLIVAKISKP